MAVDVVLEALCDGLRGTAGMAGVAVYSGLPPLEALGQLYCLLGVEQTRAELETLTLPHVPVWAQYSVQMVIVAYGAPEGGPTGQIEASIRNARTAAVAVLGSVDAYLRSDSTLAGRVDDARLVSWTLEQSPADPGSMARISAEIRVREHA